MQMDVSLQLMKIIHYTIMSVTTGILHYIPAKLVTVLLYHVMIKQNAKTVVMKRQNCVVSGNINWLTDFLIL